MLTVGELPDVLRTARIAGADLVPHPLVVDLSAPGTLAPHVAEDLRSCPAVTIGVAAGAPARSEDRLLHGFDVLLTDQPLPTEGGRAGWVHGEVPRDLEDLTETVVTAPLASRVLVQVLRFAERREVEEGLIAESTAYSTLQSGPEFRAWLTAQPTRRPRPDETPVTVTRHGATLHVELNRPHVRNAFNAAMREALVDLLAAAELDPALARVVLTGNGPAFCAGGDLAEFGVAEDPARAHALRTDRSVGRLLARLSDRVEARLHGVCVGAGIELPAFAGHVVAAPDAEFGLPEVAMGLIPGAGGTVSLPRRIGAQRTSYLALVGRRIDAPAALSWGLVDELSDEEPPSG